MSYTGFKVYIDFDYTGTGNPDYTQSYDDISEYVQKVEINTKGKPPIADVGTCKLTLENPDDRFSYDNSDSPLYHKFKKELPIKVVAYDHLGATYTRFNGWTDDLSVKSGVYSSATITASNIFKLLQSIYPAIPVTNDYRTDQLITFIMGYALRGTIASNYLILDNPSAVDSTGTINLNGDVYTFVTSGLSAPYEVLIPSTTTVVKSQQQLDALAAAINGSTGGGVIYSSDISSHPEITATTPTDTLFRGIHLGNPGYQQLNPRWINLAGDATIINNLGGCDGQRRQSPANGDIWAIDIEVPISTTYKLLTYVHTASISGILKIYLDDVLEDTWDMYSAFVCTNGTRSTDLTMTAGAHRIKFVIDGKNASSGGYTFNLIEVALGTGIIEFQSRYPGTVGNTFTLSRTGDFSTNSSIQGATFSGGTDEPNGLTSFETGKLSPSIAGDTWGAQTNALTALSEVAQTEVGWLFVAMDGTVTFKNRDFLQKLHLTGTPKVTIDNQATLGSGLRGANTYNRFALTFKPRTELVTGVLASTTERFNVKDNTGTERTNANDPLPDPPATFFTLQAIDPDTKQPMGIISVDNMIPGTHYDAGFHFDLDYLNDYFLANPQIFSLYVAVNGNNIEITAKLTNGGASVLLSNIEVRGIGVVKYDPLTISLDKENNTDKAISVLAESIPLPIAYEIAYSYLEFLRDRYSTPEYVIDSVDLGVNDVINGVEVINLQIGDLVPLGDDTLHIDASKHFITGMKQNFEVGNIVSTTLYVKRCNIDAYLILDNASYGLIDTNVLGY